MKITILTVVYNGEKTIERTIRSVMREKMSDPDIEYVLVDGKSNDKTMEIVWKYREFIDMCISEKDDGIYDAINKGIKHSTGDYTLFLAADDVLLENSITKFKKSILSETDVWCGSTISFIDGAYYRIDSDPDLQNLYKRCSLRHPATFFKRSLFFEYGFYNKDLKCAGDREIFLRLYTMGVKFQIERIPITFFSVGGISWRETEIVVSEDKRISVWYGMNEEDAERYYSKQVNIKAATSVLHKTIRELCVKLHILKWVRRLGGNKGRLMTKKEVRRYGIEI